MSKSVSDWLKSLHQKSPNRALERNNEEAVLKSLLSEVEIQMRRREEDQRMRQLATKRRGSLVDYTWLASSSTAPRADALSPVEKVELAELCLKLHRTVAQLLSKIKEHVVILNRITLPHKYGILKKDRSRHRICERMAYLVKPCECNYVICQFRRMASADCEASEVPRLMRTAISEMLLEREEGASGNGGGGNDDLSKSSRVSRVMWRALSAVKTPRRVSPWANPRRNSSASTSSRIQNNIFTVERAYSFPLLRIDKMGNLQMSPQHQQQQVVSLV